MGGLEGESETAALDSDVFPYDDEVPLETTQHRIQMEILIHSLQDHLEERRLTAYVAGSNFLYYQRRPRKFVGPDVYVVLGREDHFQKSYVVWEEDGRYPDVIFELLSKRTEKKDRNVKFQLYQDTFRTPEYFLYDPLDGRFDGFQLKGNAYVPIQPQRNGHLRCTALNLSLGRMGGWLRWFTSEGNILPTARERLHEQRQISCEAKECADQAAQRSREMDLLKVQADRRAEEARLRAEEARRRLQQAEQEAEQRVAIERAARQDAESKMRALLEELRRLRRPDA